MTTFQPMSQLEPAEVYCKSCERRFNQFTHDYSGGCPNCSASPEQIIPTFSVQYLNHIRLKHPELGIRGVLKNRGVI